MTILIAALAFFAGGACGVLAMALVVANRLGPRDSGRQEAGIWEVRRGR